MPSLGKMRNQVRITSVGRTPDGAGGYTRSDPDVTVDTNDDGNVWAEVRAPNAKEMRRAGSNREVLAWSVTIRYRTDVKHGQTIKWDSRDLYVLTTFDPSDKQDKEWLVLLCREGGGT